MGTFQLECTKVLLLFILALHCEILIAKFFFSTTLHRKTGTTREDDLFFVTSQSTIRGSLIIVLYFTLCGWTNGCIRE